jgi:ribosomal protein S18 acetylase RimI-like enzyme
VIRNALPADLGALQSIFKRASLSNTGDRDALLDHPAALVYAWPDDPTFRCRVSAAHAGGNIAGFATTTRSDQVVELVDLFVDPECMRQGIARSLLDDVVVHARTTGARRIEVDGNPHAQAFYTAVGFVTGSMVVTEFGPGLRLVRRL